MVRIRILRPSKSWSERKSIAHTWFGAAGGERSSRSFADDPALGRFVAQLQAFFGVEPVDPLHVHLPALAPQEHVDPAVAVADPGLGDLADALAQDRLRRPAGGVMGGRPAAPEHCACAPDAHLPDLPGLVDQLAAPRRP